MKKLCKYILSLFMITTIFTYLMLNLKGQQTSKNNTLIFSIVFEYFGMDANQIEKIITIPFEKKLNTLDNIAEIKSSSQNNISTIILFFNDKTNFDTTYLQLKKQTDFFYQTLPQDVQKPQIYCSNYTSPFQICYSLSESKSFLEQEIKPLLDSLDGVSETVISGTTDEQLNIKYNLQKINNYNLTPQIIASLITKRNTQDYIINSKTEKTLSQIILKNKLNSIKKFSNIELNINDKTIPLNSIATINYNQKDKTELTLLNNNETTFIAIKAIPSANLIQLSQQCKKILTSKKIASQSAFSIYDYGKDQQDELIKILISFILTSIIISAFILLLYKSYYLCFLLVCIICISFIWTLGTLSLLNLSITTSTLSGLSISIGLIADVPLVIFECKKNISSLAKSIMMSTISTLIVLLPFAFLKTSNFELSGFALSIFFMLTYSTFISLFFLPKFLTTHKFNLQKSSPTFFISKLNFVLSFINRKKIKNQLSKKMKFLILIFSSILFCTLIFFINKDFSLDKNQNTILATIEFNPEKTKEQIQLELKEFLLAINSIKEIKYSKVKIIKGKAELELIAKQKKHKKIIIKLNTLRSTIPTGTLFLPSVTNSNKINTTTIQLAIIGDTDTQCKKLCKELLTKVNNKNILSAVLNFKDDQTSYTFTPDLLKLQKLNFSVKELSNLLRWYVYEPIIDKTFINDKEIDISSTTTKNLTLTQLENLELNINKNTISLSNLGTVSKTKNPISLYRINSRPCSYFTIECPANKTTSVIKYLKSSFQNLSNINHYRIKIPLDYTKQKNSYALLIKIIFFVFIFLFLFIASQNEKILNSLEIILSIPFSLILPCLLKLFFYHCLTLGDLCGIILVAGISINNVIYVYESRTKIQQHQTSSIFLSIIISSLTTIISSLILFIFSSDSFSKSISFIMFWGIISSMLISLIFYPSFLVESDGTS